MTNASDSPFSDAVERYQNGRQRERQERGESWTSGRIRLADKKIDCDRRELRKLDGFSGTQSSAV